MEIDGFYYSEKDVISLHFMSESTLFVMFDTKDGKESKILYTPKFYPGSYRQLEDDNQPDYVKMELMRVS